MGNLMKLSQTNESVRVTLPKDDLADKGVVDEDGNLAGDHWAKIDDDGDGFTVRFIRP